MAFRKKFKNVKGFAGRAGEKVKTIVEKFPFSKKPKLIEVKDKAKLYLILKKKAQDSAFQRKLFEFAPLIEEFDPWLNENNLSERLPALTEKLLEAEAEDRFHARKGIFTKIQINDKHFTMRSHYQLLIFALNFALENEFFRKRFFQKMKEGY